MNDRASNHGFLKIDGRPNARIVRSALDEVKAIQTLLADVYKDVGDGRTLLRELVQNADDARAERLVFTVLERGWPDAQNSLLHGPALLVANNGPFPAKDRDALHQALGGSKAGDAGKVGTFGIGLKSVFHICEAIIYVGAAGRVLCHGALNPWAGTGAQGDEDPLHPDWDKVDHDDRERLLGAANELLGGLNDGLIQWIPLRRTEHLDRAQDRQYGLGQVCPAPDEVSNWFGRSTSLALLLSQCGHLRSIEADQAASVETLSGRVPLARVSRPTDTVWVGRPVEDRAVQDRTFGGRIEATGRAWSITGIEAVGSDVLRALRSDEKWPKDPQWRDGRSEWVPRKALAHASITILRPDGPAEKVGVRVRWAVFLPLDDDPNPRTTTVVEALGPASGDTAWDIVLHGYFWPSHDRRSIPGVTEDDLGSGDNEVRVRWNRGVRDELLLPLLPGVLARAVVGVADGEARELVEAVSVSQIVRSQITAATRRFMLLPVVAIEGVRWETREGSGVRVLSIPAWTQSPDVVRRLFSERLGQDSEDAVFIDANAPRLSREPDEWTAEWLERVLSCIPASAFRSPVDLQWIQGLVRHVLGPQPDVGDERTAAIARWIAERIGEGSLALTTEGAFDDAQRELRAAWRKLFATLPDAWLVDAPVESQQAVAELAAKGLVGEHLLPIPLGRRPRAPATSRPDPERLDFALLELGRRMAETDGVSKGIQRSRLLLAETLLALRGDRPLGEDLRTLPLLRARRLPDDKDEAWSVGELLRETERRRVFARPRSDDGNDSTGLESPSDPKRAVVELADGLGEHVWFVNDAVASTACAPIPTADALARAVLNAKRLQADPKKRAALLLRLAANVADSTVRTAVRALLTGRVAGADEESELYYVRSQDYDRDVNRKTLETLLGLLDRSWCAVPAELVELLRLDLVGGLGVRVVDAGVLDNLLVQCLEPDTEWSRLELSDVLHLLKHLHGTSNDIRAHWRAMPLHRGVTGERESFDERALRAAGNRRLPGALEAETRLLDPDREVAELYYDVPDLTDDGILHRMLVSERPQQFAQKILHTLRFGHEKQVTLPKNAELRNLLKDASWLPDRADGSGISPEQLLVAPQELRSCIAPLLAPGALGDHRLPEDVALELWDDAEDVVCEIIGRPNTARQIQRVASALNPDRVAQVDDGAYLILPEPGHVNVSLVEDALQTPLTGSHPGWAIVRAAARAVGVLGERLGDAPAASREGVLAVTRALCAPVPVECQASMLTAISASRPPKETPSGRLFRRLVDCFAGTDDFFEQVLARLDLPTQDEQWHSAGDVARSESGVGRRHRLVSDLRASLRLDSDDPVSEERSTEVRIGSGTADTLEKYFDGWTNRLPPGAVGAFLGLLGDGNDHVIAELAERWLGDDVSVEGMRRDLISGCAHDPCASVKVYVSGRVAQGNRVEAVNILGQRVEMEAGADNDSVFATDPVRQHSLGGDFWEINLRDVEPQNRTEAELIRLLGATVEWWAVRILRIERQDVRDWWSRWGPGSQAQVGPVQASILAHLPLTLYQLDVRACEPLRDALREAQRAQRKREQAPAAHFPDAMYTERSALDRLGDLIRNEATQDFLWGRVREVIERFGYRADSVLLELAQNADDALAQAAEIAGGPPPLAARRLLVRVHEDDDQPTVDITHYGRPINDTGGAAFPAGRDRQWDEDLYFMMLLNLSGKPGEVPGGTSASSTTGRFGLGFKSVHLVSPNPSVRSGFIAFSIAGGLLPLEQPVADDPDLLPVEGHRATRVRLPLRHDIETSDLIAGLFQRFAYARALLPVFARQLREIVVDGGPCAGVSVFDGEPIDGAPGWSVAAGTTELPGYGHWRVVRFRPADTGAEPMGTAALAFGLRDDVPTDLPPGLPFLWNVTPTSEGWGCGYAINGPFKLDPGRTHVSLDDAATLEVINLLGESLGKGLVDLHDALVRSTSETSHGLLAKSDAPAFLASLWMILASGIDTRDELRGKFLLRLHGTGRGLSAWMCARPVVPSHLPAPFSERLPPLTPDMRIEVAVGGLDDPGLCRALAGIEDLVSVVQSHRAVAGEVAQRLRALSPTPIGQLQPSDILSELADRWDNVLTPERLHTLRPFAQDAVWKKTTNGPPGVTWHSKLIARSRDGTLTPLRNLLVPQTLDSPEADADVEDELRRAAFAPAGRILDPAYIESREDLVVFLRLRARFHVDAAMIASWYEDLPPKRRPAALRYLLYGKLQQEVLQWLIPAETRPLWLDDYDGVHRMLTDLGEEHWRCQSLLAALFPDRFEEQRPAPKPVLPDAVKRSFFERFDEWWNEPAVRSEVVTSYEKTAWPAWLQQQGVADGLRAESHDHWLALLVLGACQSLGQAHDGQHRCFLEKAHQNGWWDVFKAPDDTGPWMEVLRTWQDDAVASLEYSRWMSLFPAIYQLSRYRERYRRLLISSAKRPAELYRVRSLLAPRDDEALTGAGQHFDAPPAPLNMGLHWVLRELARVRILDGQHVFPDCWVPSERVLRFLQPLGLEPPDRNSSNSEKARSIFNFLAAELRTDAPHLHHAFDIPLRHVDSRRELRCQFGLEQ